MTRGNLWPRPGRWIAPAAVVVGCFGSLPLWLAEESMHTVGDPSSLADGFFSEVLFDDGPPVSDGRTASAFCSVAMTTAGAVSR